MNFVLKFVLLNVLTSIDNYCFLSRNLWFFKTLSGQDAAGDVIRGA